jgi:hypothetical protein
LYTLRHTDERDSDASNHPLPCPNYAKRASTTVKTLYRWTLVSSTIAALTIGLNLSLATNSTAQTAAIALKSDQVTLLEGQSSGAVQDKICAGYVAKDANHRVKLDRSTNLSFTLEGANDATLLIIGSNDQRFCVQADAASKGKITIPGRWSTGNYDIFVGSRSGSRANYKLTIGPLEL